MLKTSWKTTSLALLIALGLSGCGNGDDAPDTEEEPAESVVTEQPADEPAAPETDETGDEEPPAGVDEGEEVSVGEPGEVEAEAETLGESPGEVLEEGEALPGETTRDDVDAIIEETERRFDEATRRIDEQFEEVEQEASELAPMDSADQESGQEPLEPMDPEEMQEYDSPSSLEEDEALPGGTDVDAIIEEQERRFEEAQRRLEEQFEEAERRNPELDSLEFDQPLDIDGGGEEAGDAGAQEGEEAESPTASE
jgi:vacuolar-type H+-ATPase subunit H